MARTEPKKRRMNRRSFIGVASGVVTGLALFSGSAMAEANPPNNLAKGKIDFEGNIDWTEDYLHPSLFDLADFKVTGNGRVLHWELPLGDGKPYTLLLEDQEELRYTQRGANTNFEEDGDHPLVPKPGTWRGVVREEVTLDRDGGELAFGHSVTRVDFFAQPGMDPVGAIVLGLGAFDEERFQYYKSKSIPNPGGNEPGPK